MPKKAGKWIGPAGIYLRSNLFFSSERYFSIEEECLQIESSRFGVSEKGRRAY